MKTANEMKAQILSRADEDGAFRSLLMTDPRAAVADETGLTVPDGFKLVVHEDSATTAHLVLPPSPELTEADLALAAGGHHGGDPTGHATW
jgi:hypothetical protein